MHNIMFLTACRINVIVSRPIIIIRVVEQMYHRRDSLFVRIVSFFIVHCANGPVVTIYLLSVYLECTFSSAVIGFKLYMDCVQHKIQNYTKLQFPT